jgi:hypothetical protein
VDHVVSSKRADSPARRWSDGSTASGVRPRRTPRDSFRPHSNPTPPERPLRLADLIESATANGNANATPLPPPSDFDTTFRVYTASELKDAPLRASYRPPPSITEELNEGARAAQAAGPRQLVKWLGFGAAGGALLLALLLAAFSLGDDTQKTTKSYATSAPPTTAITPTPTPVDTSAATPTDEATPNDLELPDDAPVGAGRAASKRGAKPKRK